MQKRLDRVITIVADMYVNSDREFAKWGFENHVVVVADWAEKIANDKKANIEFCVAAAYLHDIADTWRNRGVGHDQESLEKAYEILKECGFTKAEQKDICENAIAGHSCKPGSIPSSIEGKIVATADAMAHLSTSFYIQFIFKNFRNDNYNDFSKWLIKKIDRDYFDKIFWDKYRKQVKNMRDALKLIFSK